MSMKIHDVTIIGAGPAGIAAAIQLKRYGLEPLLLEAHQVGGLLLNANLVENYPGFPQGIPGPELVKLCQAQLDASGVQVHFAEVRRVSFVDGIFLVETTKKLYARLVIVASGTEPKSEKNFSPEVRERVFYEVYPLLGTRGKQIAIIGAGDAAFDYALNLARANDVTILNRGREIKALPLLIARASINPQIVYREQTALREIQTAPDGLRLLCANGSQRLNLRADYLLCALGRRPQLDFLTEDLRSQREELAARGLLYFIGDVKNARYRQTAIAVGDGIHAAMRAYHTLKEGEL